MDKLNILLTNDDGYDAPGLLALCKEFSKIGEVTVVAPLFEQSGTGHGITVHNPLRLKSVEIAGAKSAWALQGMPADCVKLGMEHCCQTKPDLVVSGINRGANLGTDVLYSGTVSGALEALVNEIPSIAVSVDRFGEANNEFAAKIAAKVALWWQSKSFAPFCSLNLNIPACAQEDIQGLKLCKLGKVTYSSAYEERYDPMGRQYFWLGGSMKDVSDNGLTDTEAIGANYISLTPLQVDFTNYDILNDLAQNNEFKDFGL